MPIVVGQKLGRYRIEEEIGAGGMGVVYRAYDEKLERELAIKVLTPGTLDDEGARKRFRNEALVLSRLNHPSIQTIYDFDTVDGYDLLISELVQGVSVDARLHAGAMPEKEVIRLAVQLAQGLAAAHAEKILHRDLKPANLRVTPDGRLKILDFGLATLSREDVLTISKTTDSLPHAPSGVSGTLPYMAPEQLLGEAADGRSDIYSAGVALFEMATGRMPFAEAVVPKLTNAILNDSPPTPRALVPKLSVELERIILKCLEKDPELRYQSAKELAADLRRIEAGSTRASAANLPVQRKRPRWVYAALAVGTLAIVTLAITMAPWLRERRAPSGPPVLRWEQLTSFTDSATVPAVSPDGKVVAFIRGPGRFGGSTAQGQVWIKALPDGDAIQLTNTRYRGKHTLAFAPDGTRLYFTQVEGQFHWNTYEIPLLGGQSPQLLMANATGLIWIGKDRLLFSEMRQGIHMGVVTSNLSRTDKRDVYVPSDSVNGMAHRSALSPDGKWVLVVEMDSRWWIRCRLVPFDGSSPGREVGPEGSCTAAQWSPDGKWMYFTADAESTGFHIWRQRFPDGVPEQLTPRGASEEEGVAVMPDGSLITAAGTQEATIWLHDEHGERQITSEGFAFLPTLSPDSKRVYYLQRIPGARSFLSGELRVADIETGRTERLLPGLVLSHYSLSHDGKRVVFVPEIGGDKKGVWVADVGRFEAPKRVSSNLANRAFFGAPGEILYEGVGVGTRRIMRVSDDGTDERPAHPADIIQLMNVSPDGKWAIVGAVATEGSRLGATIIQAVPLRGGDPITVCDTCVQGFGSARMYAPFASWSHDGKWIYFPLRYITGANNNTAVLPVRPEAVPGAAIRGATTEDDFKRMPGVRLIPETDMAPGATPDTYIYARATAKANLYRIYLSDK